MDKNKAEQLKSWIQSDTGQKALDEAYKQTKKVVDDLIESRKFTFEELHRPFNI